MEFNTSNIKFAIRYDKDVFLSYSWINFFYCLEQKKIHNPTKQSFSHSTKILSHKISQNYDMLSIVHFHNKSYKKLIQKDYIYLKDTLEYTTEELANHQWIIISLENFFHLIRSYICNYSVPETSSYTFMPTLYNILYYTYDKMLSGEKHKFNDISFFIDKNLLSIKEQKEPLIDVSYLQLQLNLSEENKQLLTTIIRNLEKHESDIKLLDKNSIDTILSQNIKLIEHMENKRKIPPNLSEPFLKMIQFQNSILNKNHIFQIESSAQLLLTYNKENILKKYTIENKPALNLVNSQATNSESTNLASTNLASTNSESNSVLDSTKIQTNKEINKSHTQPAITINQSDQNINISSPSLSVRPSIPPRPPPLLPSLLPISNPISEQSVTNSLYPVTDLLAEIRAFKENNKPLKKINTTTEKDVKTPTDIMLSLKETLVQRKKSVQHSDTEDNSSSNEDNSKWD